MENCIVTQSKLLIGSPDTNFISCRVSFVLRCFYKSTLVVCAVARTVSRSVQMSFVLHQMSVRELRHDRPSGRFSKSRGLSASVSFLSSPPPPRSFTCAIFRAVFDSCSSFFAPKPHRNACYAGYIPREFQRLITGKLTGLDPGRPQNLQRRKVEVTSRKPK